MDLTKQIYLIFDKLGNSLVAWTTDIIAFFDTHLSKKLTASISWGFFNKQLVRKVEKFYDLVQDAVDDTEFLMFDNDQAELTEDLKQAIKTAIEPKLKTYQHMGEEFLKKYEIYADKLDSESWQELSDIVFNITTDNILSIIEEKLNE